MADKSVPSAEYEHYSFKWFMNGVDVESLTFDLDDPDSPKVHVERVWFMDYNPTFQGLLLRFKDLDAHAEFECRVEDDRRTVEDEILR